MTVTIKPPKPSTTAGSLIAGMVFRYADRGMNNQAVFVKLGDDYVVRLDSGPCAIASIKSDCHVEKLKFTDMDLEVIA